MFDEEGRKIDLETPRARELSTLSVDDMQSYIYWLQEEIVRTKTEMSRRNDTRSMADAFFK